MPIIGSILDNDKYKFAMQKFVLEMFPDASGEYRFILRQRVKPFTKEFIKELQYEINSMSQLSLNRAELAFLHSRCPYFGVAYMTLLKQYRFDPSEVEVEFVSGDIFITIKGALVSAILWEVPLLAIISELYFRMIDTDWSDDGQSKLAGTKAISMETGHTPYADFGTRRRRSLEVQRQVIREFNKFAKITGNDLFLGTSNVMIAMEQNLEPIGTMAHEIFMLVSALVGLRHANKFTLEYWNKVYGGELGIALTDTFTTKAFLADFDGHLARVYDGVRHDSGDPFAFIDTICQHYTSLGIDPETKTIVFSDGLDVERAIRLNSACYGRIKCVFGIGTHFTNDFKDSPALNMVIKLWKVAGIPVVKLSDESGKVCGDRDAVTVAKWMFKGAPLCSA